MRFLCCDHIPDANAVGHDANGTFFSFEKCRVRDVGNGGWVVIVEAVGYAT